MAAFVGFIAGSNSIVFPWALTSSGIQFSDIAAAGGPAAQWDALPTESKLQIFGAIFFLELWGESRNALAACGEKHYMSGGKPGFYPSFKNAGLPHEVRVCAHARQYALPYIPTTPPRTCTATSTGALRPVGPLRLRQEDEPREEREVAARGDQ